VLFVGLTGGIGSGKSTVARLLAEHGAVVLDADVLAREAVSQGSPGYLLVVDRFGAAVVGPGGDLDRQALADLVFHDDKARRALEAIVHPEVRRLTAEAIAEQAGTDAVVVLDSPLLIETDAHTDCEVVVVVSAPEQALIARSVARGMDESDVRARLAAQLPLEDKVALADIVLDNQGSRGELEAQVDGLWAELRRRADADS
jgi:dephospho-CoA kinase